METTRRIFIKQGVLSVAAFGVTTAFGTVLPNPAIGDQLPQDLLDADNSLKQMCLLVNPYNEPPVIVSGISATESEQFAAKELSEHLAKITGREIKIVNENNIPQDRKFIAVGQNELTKNEDVASLAVEQYIISVKPEGLLIVGGRKEAVKDSTGKEYVRDRGTLYGVYDFLESLGVRWYRPEPWGWYIPKKDVIQLAVKKTVATPTFIGRTAPRKTPKVIGQKPEDIELATLWAARQRLNVRASDDHQYGGELEFIDNWHTQSRVIVQPGQYLKSHPEYFALINGKRGNPGTGRTPQLCLGNTDLQNVFAQNVITLAKKNLQWDLVPMDPEDGTQLGTRMCTCPLCIAMDDPADPQNMANRVFGFANIISRKVARELPDLKLGLYAYSAHTQAPAKIDKLEPNIIVALANINSWCDQTKKMFDSQSPQNAAFVKLVKDWQRVATHKLWMREYSAYGWLGPIPMYRMLQDHVQSYEKLGFEAFVWPSEANWGSQMPLIYFKSQLQRNPNLDLDAELNLFYSNYYGPAALPMKAYYEKWMDVFDESHIAAGEQGGVSSGGRGMHMLCTPALINELGNHLGQATTLVKGQPLYEKRLEGVTAEYQLCQYVSKMISLKIDFGEVKVNPQTSTTFLQTPKAEEEWNAMMEWLKIVNNDQQNFEVQLKDNQPYATALLYMKRDILENGKYSLFNETALLKAQGFEKR